MPSGIKSQQKQSTYTDLDATELLALLAEKDQLLEHKNERLTQTNDQLTRTNERLTRTNERLTQTNERLEVHQQQLSDKDQRIQELSSRIRLLEEYLRLAKVQRFGASSEKGVFQSDLFDEAELEVALSELESQLPEEDRVRPRAKTRKRGFSEDLERIQIHLTLTDDEKAGATRTFFTRVKEELEFIPAQVKVLEYWQEKAVFDTEDAPVIVAAQRPVHPLGKCFASPSLLAHIVASKYADGLPLYRLEGMLKRYGGDISRSNMSYWIVRLHDVFLPLINLIREKQLEGDYLQGDETRMPVLKETGKTAQSDKWTWVIRGGPPDKPAVLFDYDPSRAGKVPMRLLEGFAGVLQAAFDRNQR